MLIILAAMNIAVNTRLLLPGKLEGIGWFAHETLKRITRQHSGHEFIFLFDRPYSEDFIYADNITPVAKGPQARHPLLWKWWFERTVPKILKKHKADIFLSPDGYLPLKTDVPSLAVIHDINFVHYPEYLHPSHRKYFREYFPRFAQKAKRIATVSQYSKQDIAENYHIPEEKIDVVYNGANDSYKPLSEEEQQKVREQYAEGKPYFLFIGAMHPRKNIANLLYAFDAFREAAQRNVLLMLVGEKMWWTPEMEKALLNMKHRSDVIFSGRLEDEELKKVIPSALALAYVSRYEGFGIPIIEAMNCDVPVITSSVTSMPETAGDAALLADPVSVESIKSALLKIAGDESLRNILIEKGRIQRQKFSWEKTAGLLWNSIGKTMGGR